MASWHSLPTEIKLVIIDGLDADDVQVLAKVDQGTYHACVPALFRKIKLSNYESLEQFLTDVPRSYYSHILELDLCTANTNMHSPNIPSRTRADSIISLLSATPRLTKLSLTMHGSLDKSIVSPFPFLSNLQELSIANCGDEKMNPVTERLVLSIALSIRNLQVLSLDRITRSKMHATELDGHFTHVPLALNDQDIPSHPNPLIASHLSLPSLLLIPTLRSLTIRDTHLGDPRWTSTPVACRLQVLDLGSCYHEDDGFNSRCTERIMAAVGPTIDEFSLTAAVSDPSKFAKPSFTPLPRLRKLHISPFFPLGSVVDTMSNLAGSPVERISVQCFEDDVVDMCEKLEEFLTLRVERGPGFYQRLKQIDVAVTVDVDSTSVSSGVEEDEDERDEKVEREEAARRLQEFCRDLRLGSVIRSREKVGLCEMKPLENKRVGKVRSMTI